MIASLACAAGLAAQDAPPAPNAPAGDNQVAVADDQAPAPDPAQRPQFNDPPPPPPGMAPAPRSNGNSYAPVANIPATLTLPSGAFITVRVNQWLSSDRNKVGDTFYATLVQPLIVKGVVVAQRGSTVIGRVSAVKKSHTDGPSSLGLQLVNLSLVDGRQMDIQSLVMDRTGTTTPAAREAAGVVGATAVGAGVGAVAGGGMGAAIGAGVGAMAGGIGAVLTHGHPTEIYPESMLTFRIDSPATISTADAPDAFHFATQEDYAVAPQTRTEPAPGVRRAGPVGYGYAPYGAYPYPYYPYYDPYFYGPGFGVVIGGRGFGGFGGFGGRGGFRRR